MSFWKQLLLQTWSVPCDSVSVYIKPWFDIITEYSDGTKATVHPRIAVNDQGEGKFVGSHT